MKKIPEQGEKNFGEWIAELINHGLTDQEILTYLDPDTREEDLVAFVRHLMLRIPEDISEDELPAGVEAVCEMCGKPASYDSEFCLCGDCERYDGLAVSCRRCGSPLNPDGHCVDITCPFSYRSQDEEYTEV